MIRVHIPLAVLLATFLVPVVAVADQAIERVLAATVRIAGENGSGTGFFVSVEGTRDGQPATRVWLVTAAHVLEGTPGENCVLVLRNEVEGKTVRADTPLRVRENGAPLWKRHPAADVAAIEFAPPAGSAVKPLPVQSLASRQDVDERKVRVAQEAWLPGFPAQLEGNAIGWPILRRGSIASHPIAPVAENPMLLVDVTSFGGDSGAPLVVDPTATKKDDDETTANEFRVVGVLLGMHRQTSRTVTPFEEKISHVPLGLSFVVHAALARDVIEPASNE